MEKEKQQNYDNASRLPQGGKKDIEEYMASIYYDPLHAGSYSGIQKFWNVIKTEKDVRISFKQVKEWLKKQEG